MREEYIIMRLTNILAMFNCGQVLILVHFNLSSFLSTSGQTITCEYELKFFPILEQIGI